jgi:hypothetical protein
MIYEVQVDHDRGACTPTLQGIHRELRSEVVSWAPMRPEKSARTSLCTAAMRTFYLEQTLQLLVFTPSSMSPSTRPDTPQSIHSWWSDRNSLLQGPTINLHTLAKPFLKRMHHRQALQLIEKNRGIPLSRDVLETYSSYFPYV